MLKETPLLNKRLPCLDAGVKAKETVSLIMPDLDKTPECGICIHVLQKSFHTL